MKILKLTLAILFCNSLSMADNFNEKHKINKSYIKTMAKTESNYLEINGKEELKKAIKEKKLNSNYEKDGKKHIYIDIKNVHLTKRDLKELDEVNIGSNIKGDGKVVQNVNIKRVRLDTNKPINIGVRITGDRKGSITAITNIENSQLGR